MTDGREQDSRKRKRRDWIGIRSSGGPLAPWPFDMTVVAIAAALVCALVLYPVTGLGPSTCGDFVEVLGGSIQTANRLDGPGAVFTITFPKSVFTALPREDAAE